MVRPRVPPSRPVPAGDEEGNARLHGRVRQAWDGIHGVHRHARRRQGRDADVRGSFELGVNMDKVYPAAVAAALTEHWSPRVVAELDDSYVKVAKVQGTLAWHAHDAEDELFYILTGLLTIEMEDRTVVLREGEAF